jgi:hypothetical protein
MARRSPKFVKSLASIRRETNERKKKTIFLKYNLRSPNATSKVISKRLSSPRAASMPQRCGPQQLVDSGASDGHSAELEAAAPPPGAGPAQADSELEQIKISKYSTTIYYVDNEQMLRKYEV